MIVVPFDLVSAVDDSRDRSLGRLEISNDGAGTKNCWNYDIALYSAGEKPRKIREARIENWNRDARPAWRLVAEAFQVIRE